MSNRDRSARYTAAFQEVKRVLDERDPIGLLAGGAPADEYDPEVADLVRLVLRPQPPLPAEVDAVWQRWFGPSCSLGSAAVPLAAALAEVQRRFPDTQPPAEPGASADRPSD